MFFFATFSPKVQLDIDSSFQGEHVYSFSYAYLHWCESYLKFLTYAHKDTYTYTHMLFSKKRCII